MPSTTIKNKILITHTERPLANLGSTGISMPSTSFGFEMSNMANMVDIEDHMDVSAKCLPGQMRRPNPNVRCSIMFGRRDQSSARNCSGMNLSGFGYLDSSWAMDHRFVSRTAPAKHVRL